MKFIVNSSDLLKQLNAIQSVIHSGVVMSILENYHFSLNKNTLSVTACDLETTATVDMQVESTDTGKICIPSKVLMDSLKNLYDQPLTFQVDEGEAKITITSSSGQYKITGSKDEEFPINPQSEAESEGNTELKAIDLYSAISKTIVGVSNDEMKPEMNGILFEFKSSDLSLVSTDSHRLVVCKLNEVSNAKERSFIVPKKPLNLLKNILQGHENENATLSFNNSHFFLEIQNFKLACRLIDAKFPDYKVVIPDSCPYKLTIERTSIQNSLNRVRVFSNKSTNMVKFEIAGQGIHLFASDKEYAMEANESLECKYDGGDMTIGFNSKFLVELLQITPSEEVQFELTSPSKPTIITPTEKDDNIDFKMLLMPLMLQSQS